MVGDASDHAAGGLAGGPFVTEVEGKLAGSHGFGSGGGFHCRSLCGFVILGKRDVRKQQEKIGCEKSDKEFHVLGVQFC